jgi:hypothetical protein
MLQPTATPPDARFIEDYLLYLLARASHLISAEFHEQLRQDTRDRRVVRVALTARGEMIASELVQAAKQHEAEVLARHPEAEAMAIKSLLRAIVSRQSRPRRG